MFRFAQENGLMFLEASAKTGECVEEAFLKCSKSILAKIETGELDPERIGSGTYLSFTLSPIENATREFQCLFPYNLHRANCLAVDKTVQ